MTDNEIQSHPEDTPEESSSFVLLSLSSQLFRVQECLLICCSLNSCMILLETLSKGETKNAMKRLGASWSGASARFA